MIITLPLFLRAILSEVRIFWAVFLFIIISEFFIRVEWVRESKAVGFKKALGYSGLQVGFIYLATLFADHFSFPGQLILGSSLQGVVCVGPIIYSLAVLSDVYYYRSASRTLEYSRSGTLLRSAVSSLLISLFIVFLGYLHFND